MCKSDVEEIFYKIYTNRTWESKKNVNFSGGASNPVFLESYIPYVVSFIKDNHIKKIVDIGCGDFRVLMHFVE